MRHKTNKKLGDKMQEQKNGEMRRKTKKIGDMRRETKKMGRRDARQKKGEK